MYRRALKVLMKRKDFKRSDKVFFHNTGLSDTNKTQNGWKMRTFLSLRKELGHSKSPIDVLKVDIEQWEQVTIPEMVASGSLRDVKQFAVEIHIDLGHITRKQDPKKEKYIQVLKGFRDLYDAGFRIVHFHCNPYCLFKFKSGQKGCSCHEVQNARFHARYIYLVDYSFKLLFLIKKLSKSTGFMTLKDNSLIFNITAKTVIKDCCQFFTFKTFNYRTFN
ncbi:hypothetical protein KUTeg_002286 [Tegillarca granosa]|uniref:Methyltransferase domain-containing protein n=1 Tax=Tegillarca granosa TaxID=220873 RepID=A0ABQ9FTY5_TEGGR|nr:hypothetical protein KUTeg_002286 [Tegillarca granosa]